jgi:hypothetical protein
MAAFKFNIFFLSNDHLDEKIFFGDEQQYCKKGNANKQFFDIPD